MALVPSQGFRHAATLLLTNRARAIAPRAPSDVVTTSLEQLAHDLTALADDMRAPAEAAAWLIDEFHRTVDRLPHTFDRERAKRTAATILGRLELRGRQSEPHDLFLIYVPEDRLPIAAPLAIELAKRRVSVAFAEYEVASSADLAAAIARGLAAHRGGVILWTPAFERAAWANCPTPTDRLRLVRQAELRTAIEDLTAWSVTLRLSKL